MSVKCVEEPAKQDETWSEEDLQCVSDNYGLISNEAIADYLKRSTNSVRNVARRLHLKMADNYAAGKTAKLKPIKLGKSWAREDLDYLEDHYGLIPNGMIAHHLKRGVTSIPETARKKLHLKLIDTFWTANELTRILAIGGSQTIVRWMRKGWLKGSRCDLGGRWFWSFVEEDIIECLRQRPWLVDLKKMERHYFRSIVVKEWDRDPWYTTTQAAPLFGTSSGTVSNYIRKGLLPAVVQDTGGAGSYFIRRSSIEAFLANDPRKRHWHDCQSESHKRRLREEGRPTRIGMLWSLPCPRCGQEVEILAPATMMGLQVREKFITVYVNGTCFHSAKVELTIPPQGV